jgi:putative heme-binding domain-containing protein
MIRTQLTTIALALAVVQAASQSSTAPKPAASLAPLIRLLADSDDASLQLDILRGMYEALRGRSKVAMPDEWPAVQRKLTASTNGEVRQKAWALAVVFGDAAGIATLKQTAADGKNGPETRRMALQTLVENRAPNLLPLLKELLPDHTLRSLVLRGLAGFFDPQIPDLVLRHYTTFNDAEKSDAISTLASRPEYALVLLDAMERGQVPRGDLSPFIVRQLTGFKNQALSDKLAKVWGTIRPTAKDKTALLARYQSIVPPAALAQADRSHGRAVFVKTCATCHMLFAEGGKIAPDLTGSQRTNPDYLLTKVLDPNAVVAKDYQMTVLRTIDGRTLSGIVKSENDQTLELQTQNELVNLAKTAIDERKRTELSLMPEGLLAPLSDVEIRDLIAYLAGSSQVPLPAKTP